MSIVIARRFRSPRRYHMQRPAHGFTLLESAIVMVIVGLLLTATLKAKELMTGARVRNLITQQAGVKAAFHSFQDRYRALPGDDKAAGAHLDCSPSVCLSGDGDGRIASPSSTGVREEILAWSHLNVAGFLSGSYRMSAATTEPDDSNTPRNSFGTFLQLGFDADWGTSGNTAKRHNLKTGNQVPAVILAEVDRKIDDGSPYTGAFQFSVYTPSSSNPPNPATCLTGGDWNVLGGETNCGASSLF